MKVIATATYNASTLYAEHHVAVRLVEYTDERGRPVYVWEATPHHRAVPSPPYSTPDGALGAAKSDPRFSDVQPKPLTD